ncbi:MAG: hypothetical protein COV44_07805 [Deltaproteobacteria bacterium CG11_big_fil_rev_8_21_14_0_20_45_16]|nr:MAG: hypothetical protein COV44_07805 [Deltaproteobacteria bacterium CG11_big_fil_rev_8_21_14_0_20_45_16]
MGLIASIFTHFLFLSLPADMDWTFVGCAWSAQECAYSCPHLGSFMTRYDPEMCWLEAPSEWACYCDFNSSDRELEIDN